MPELPEVETVRRGLHRLIIGRTVTAVEHDTPKGFPNATADVQQFLIGATVTDVRRRAKVLLIDLSTDYTLVTHLKMTGQLVFIGAPSSPTPRPPKSPGTASHRVSLAYAAGETRAADVPGDLVATVRASADSDAIPSSTRRGTEDGAAGTSCQASFRGRIEDDEFISSPSGGVNPSSDVLRFGAGHPNDSLIGELPDRSTRVTITFADGSHLYFNDQRKFGWMRLMPTVEVPNIDFMRRVGPEPLDADFTWQQFRDRFTRRARTNIKAALLDQTVIAGVGNIYADESLWGARIHPQRPVSSITDTEFKALYQELRDVMTLAIEKGGSTDKNYLNAEGKRGSYLDFARAFRREGQPCPRHPDVMIEKLRVAGRGTHICPVCQTLQPRA